MAVETKFQAFWESRRVNKCFPPLSETLSGQWWIWKGKKRGELIKMFVIFFDIWKIKSAGKGGKRAATTRFYFYWTSGSAGSSASGIKTLSMTWMTPFVFIRSDLTTVASFTCRQSSLMYILTNVLLWNYTLRIFSVRWTASVPKREGNL